PVTIAGVTGSVVPGGYNGTFTITSVITSGGNVTGFTYALATDPGTASLSGATVAPKARAFRVDFTTAMNAGTLATGNPHDSTPLTHGPSVAAVTIDAGKGSNLVNVLDVPSPGQTAAAQSINVVTGTGSDQVSIYAGQANHTFDVDVGGGGDFV